MNPITFNFNFPPEIEDQIFEDTACIYPYQREDAWLSVVCRRAKERIESILYQTIILTNAHDGSRQGMVWVNLFRRPLESRPASFFAKHVHNLLFLPSVPEGFAARVLSVCTGVRNFASLEWGFPLAPTIPLKLPELKTFTTDLRAIRLLSESGHKCSKLENLTLTCWPRDEEELFVSLRFLPSLKYIRLDVSRYREDSIPGDLKTIIETTENLEEIRISVESNDELPVDEWKKLDPRIIIEEDMYTFDRVEWRRRAHFNIF